VVASVPVAASGVIGELSFAACDIRDQEPHSMVEHSLWVRRRFLCHLSQPRNRALMHAKQVRDLLNPCPFCQHPHGRCALVTGHFELRPKLHTTLSCFGTAIIRTLDDPQPLILPKR
jgi:hypothetical protein